MLIFELESTTLAVLQVYAPNKQSEYPAFSPKVNAANKLAAKPDHFILMGDFNAHVGSDSETWRDVIKRNGFSTFNQNGELSKHGMLLSHKKSILCRWREYFSELLNPVRGTEGGRSEVFVEVESSTFVKEVTLGIKSLKSGKFAEDDEIRPEMLKALGEDGVQ